MNYFDLNFVSNSDLSELRDATSVKEKQGNIQDIYDMGNLVDYMITETHKIDGQNKSFTEGNRTVVFDDEKFDKAKLMKAAYDSDPALQKIFSGAKSQYIFTRFKFRIEYEGNIIELPVKCKFDLIVRRLLGGDIKTTAATSQAQFEDAIELFSWDRQMAWYMDIAQIDRMMIIGISKEKKYGKHQIFKKAIMRGDAMYSSGLRKYSRLAYHYYFKIHLLNQNLEL